MGGIPGATNTQLIEYGIQNEQSDIRIHVGVLAKRIYVFPTQSGVDAILSNRYPVLPAKTGNLVTAMGYLIPPNDIKDCLSIEIPDELMTEYEISPMDSTSRKGDRAVQIVKNMLIKKLIPVPLNVFDVTDEDLQIMGTDILVKTNLRFQVKCDYRAGPRELGCTGNLYLQTQECNPYKLY